MALAVPRSTPIIVGIGEIRHKSLDANDAIEPAELMLTAIRRAIGDTLLFEPALLSHIDSISVVPPWTWPYHDLPALLAGRLGTNPSHRVIGYHGGNHPALLCDEAARRISLGQSKVAIITGGEALASLAACQKAGRMPPPGWTKLEPGARPLDISASITTTKDAATMHSLGLPIHVYPMYENGLRSHDQQTLEKNNQESAALYAAFDQVACQHPYSWRFGETPRDAKAIGTVTSSNRMICTPYPLLMNAFNTVNIAAACILTSIEHAEELGIPKEKWVYVLGGAGTSESKNIWERSNFFSSPALEQSLDSALAASLLARDDVDCFDFYSCFPIVPKLACKHLGLRITNPQKPITLLGGLTSFGGAGNNYSMHAITEMARQIRRKTVQNGLVLANGGVLTYQHVVCLSSEPRKDHSEYPRQKILPEYVEGIPVPPFTNQPEGPAVVETYTVDFNRKGLPQLGYIIGRLEENGHRFIANHGNEATLRRLADTELEPIGLQGIVRKGEDGRNLFFMHSDSKL